MATASKSAGPCKDRLPDTSARCPAAALRFLAIAALCFVAAARCQAQTDTAKVSKPASDSVRAAAESDTLTPKFVMSRDPTVAVLLSIFPGGGQIYNGQYWKAPIYFGVAAYFGAQIIYYNSHYIDKANEFSSLPAGDPTLPNIRFQREFYRDNRDLNIAYLLAVEIINMIDAYVGAHLYDFDVGEDTPKKLQIMPASNGIGIGLRW